MTRNNTIDCHVCKHYRDQDCIWNYDYIETDYAYDCCDFVRYNNTNKNAPLRWRSEGRAANATVS